MTMKWQGVMPAITTPFTTDDHVDYQFLAKHCEWLVANGCSSIIALGSLGEGATLTFDEKIKILETCIETVGDLVPVIPGVSSLSTREAVELSQEAKMLGCKGLMVLPPYAYSTDWREMKAHVSAIIAATDLSCMLYNNPPAYVTDFLPEQVAELAARYSNLHAVKDSSGDVRRITAAKTLMGDRLELGVGLDDILMEGVNAGASFWVAGLVNAFPLESVKLFNLTRQGKQSEAFELYRWFLPLLRLDTVPKFVQLIKLVQEKVGMGSTRVRTPRLVIEGEELRAAEAVIKIALDNKPVF